MIKKDLLLFFYFFFLFMGIGSRASSGAWKLTEKTLCWSLHVCSMIVFWGITLGEGGGTSCWL